MNMGEIPEKFVVSKRPKEFLQQGLVHCGVYSVKAVLEAYGVADKKDPEDYHISWWGRILGVASLQSLMRVLKNYGLNAEIGTVMILSPRERLYFLKELLSKDTPVMVRIGNGYLLNGKYSPFLGRIVGHWITVWGYDDGEQVFYVYDSAVSSKMYDRDIPIGNKRRSYQEMMRDWYGGFLTSWPFWWKFVYIKIAPGQNR